MARNFKRTPIPPPACLSARTSARTRCMYVRAFKGGFGALTKSAVRSWQTTKGGPPLALHPLFASTNLVPCVRVMVPTTLTALDEGAGAAAAARLPMPTPAAARHGATSRFAGPANPTETKKFEMADWLAKRWWMYLCMKCSSPLNRSAYLP